MELLIELMPRLIGISIGFIIVCAFNYNIAYRTVKQIDKERVELGMPVPERNWLFTEKTNSYTQKQQKKERFLCIKN